MNDFSYPADTDLIEWFGSVPDVEDRVRYTFHFMDDRGTRLRFSFDVLEASIQTTLEANGVQVGQVVHEGAIKLWIDEATQTLRAAFSQERVKSLLALRLAPHVHVEWSSLVSKE